MTDHPEAEADFHRILGVQPGASPEEVRRAFRQQAMRNHPDRNPGDLGAERRFREILDAYKTALRAAGRTAERPGTAAPQTAPGAAPSARSKGPRRRDARRPHHRSRSSLNRKVSRALLLAIFTIGPLLLILLIVWASSPTDWLPGCCVE